MQDRVPVNPGRVLITPENGTAPYYATMTRADNPTQEGTALNKATLLKDATASKFGLGTDAVPDDVFSFLGKYNQHWWKRRYTGAHWEAVLSTAENRALISSDWTNSHTWYYSDTISLDDNGKITVLNPTAITISAYDASNVGTLCGKYFYTDREPYLGHDLSVIYYASADANYYDGGTYTYIYASKVTSEYVDDTTDWELLVTNSANTYTPGVSDNGEEIQYLGVPFDKFPVMPQIATGSYIATGTYGSNNPNSLTFDFAPKILAIAIQYSANNQNNSQVFVLPKPDGGVSPQKGGSCSISTWEYTKKVFTYASTDGKTVYWYSGDSATHQMNQSGFTYDYIAIG